MGFLTGAVCLYGGASEGELLLVEHAQCNTPPRHGVDLARKCRLRPYGGHNQLLCPRRAGDPDIAKPHTSMSLANGGGCRGNNRGPPGQARTRAGRLLPRTLSSLLLAASPSLLYCHVRVHYGSARVNIRAQVWGDAYRWG